VSTLAHTLSYDYLFKGTGVLTMQRGTTPPLARVHLRAPCAEFLPRLPLNWASAPAHVGQARWGWVVGCVSSV